MAAAKTGKLIRTQVGRGISWEGSVEVQDVTYGATVQLVLFNTTPTYTRIEKVHEYTGSEAAINLRVQDRLVRLDPCVSSPDASN